LGVDTYLYSFFNHGVRLGWVFNPMPRSLYPRERPGTHYRVGWVESRAGLDTKNLAPTGFDPWTVHPVASRYTFYNTGVVTSP